MRVRNGFLAWSLLAVLCAGFSLPQSSDEPAGVKVVVKRVERVSKDEVRFSVKVINRLGRPVYATGTNFEKPIPYPVFLEQWRTKEGWQIVVPCMDTAPPQI